MDESAGLPVQSSVPPTEVSSAERNVLLREQSPEVLQQGPQPELPSDVGSVMFCQERETSAFHSPESRVILSTFINNAVFRFAPFVENVF